MENIGAELKITKGCALEILGRRNREAERMAG
jgi:hypothetical protein